MMLLTEMLCERNVIVSRILASFLLLCDDFGVDCGWTNCARRLLLWMIKSGKLRALKN